jgi:hypothetical protein
MDSGRRCRQAVEGSPAGARRLRQADASASRQESKLGTREGPWGFRREAVGSASMPG